MDWLGRLKGDVFLSLGSSYTGHKTIANLVGKVSTRNEMRAPNIALSVMEDRTLLVEQVVDAKLDASFHNPPQRAIVVIQNIVDQERVVWSSYGSRRRKRKVGG